VYHQVFFKTTKFLSGLAQDDAAWLAKSSALREKLIAVGLVKPEPIPEKVIIPTLEAFLDGYIERQGKSRKPATVAVWKQVVSNLKEFMPEGIRINQITAGHDDDPQKYSVRSPIHSRCGRLEDHRGRQRENRA
jgi:hypothetical protein